MRPIMHANELILFGDLLNIKKPGITPDELSLDEFYQSRQWQFYRHNLPKQPELRLEASFLIHFNNFYNNLLTINENVDYAKHFYFIQERQWEILLYGFNEYSYICSGKLLADTTAAAQNFLKFLFNVIKRPIDTLYSCPITSSHPSFSILELLAYYDNPTGKQILANILHSLLIPLQSSDLTNQAIVSIAESASELSKINLEGSALNENSRSFLSSHFPNLTLPKHLAKTRGIPRHFFQVTTVMDYIKSDPTHCSHRSPFNGDTILHSLVGSSYYHLLSQVLHYPHCRTYIEKTNFAGNDPFMALLAQFLIRQKQKRLHQWDKDDNYNAWMLNITKTFLSFQVNLSKKNLKGHSAITMVLDTQYLPLMSMILPYIMKGGAGSIVKYEEAYNYALQTNNTMAMRYLRIFAQAIGIKTIDFLDKKYQRQNVLAEPEWNYLRHLSLQIIMTELNKKSTDWELVMPKDSVWKKIKQFFKGLFRNSNAGKVVDLSEDTWLFQMREAVERNDVEKFTLLWILTTVMKDYPNKLCEVVYDSLREKQSPFRKVMYFIASTYDCYKEELSLQHYSTEASKELLVAAIAIDLMRVYQILYESKGASVHTIDNNMMFPLTHALNGEHKRMMAALIDYGANCNIYHKNGLPALFYAVLLDDINLFHQLTKCGATHTLYAPNGTSIWEHILTHREKKFSDYASSLINAGVDINMPSLSGESVLWSIAKLCPGNAAHLMEQALYWGADMFRPNSKGMYIIHYLLENQYYYAPRFINLLTSNNISLFNTPLYKDMDVMMFAVSRYSTYLKEIIESLIRNGVSLHYRNKDGDSVVQIAIKKTPFEERLEIVEMLLRNGADPRNINNRGEMVFYQTLALYENQITDIDTDLLGPYNVNEMYNANGEPVLNSVIELFEGKSVSVLKAVVNNLGANPTTTNAQNENAMVKAATHVKIKEFTNVAAVLQRFDLDINATIGEAETILMRLLKANPIIPKKTLQGLIKLGLNIHLKAKNNQNILHYLAKNGNSEMLGVMIELGVSVCDEDLYMKNALDYYLDALARKKDINMDLKLEASLVQIMWHRISWSLPSYKAITKERIRDIFDMDLVAIWENESNQHVSDDEEFIKAAENVSGNLETNLIPFVNTRVKTLANIDFEEENDEELV